ncbi:hypothetical protein KA043_03235 [Candidatus Saccharibacteria bacterium]|nr:hypothetical protein [Candidatus Saccharibacteria bacterium]
MSNKIKNISIEQQSDQYLIPVQRGLGKSALMSPKDQRRFNYVDKRKQDSGTKGTERVGKEPYDIKQREIRFAQGEKEIRNMSSDELLVEANKILEEGGFNPSGEPISTEEALVYSTDQITDDEDNTETLEQMSAMPSHESDEIVAGLRRAKRDKIASQGNPETKDKTEEMGEFILDGMHIVK